jgi:glycosyltransferase involved in cell wall biosynthesis
MKSFDLILPVYNEVEIIEKVIWDFHLEFKSEFYSDNGLRFNEIIVIEDGSSDGTSEKLKSVFASQSNLSLLQFKQRLGYVGALNYAVGKSKAEYLIFCDSSGKYSPKDLRHLLIKINEFDIVVGKRRPFVGGFYRYILRFVMNQTIRIIYNRSISDIDSPVRILRRKLLSEIDNYPRIEKYLYNLESTLIAIKLLNCSYLEVPINYQKRRNGKSRGIPFEKIPRVILSSIKTIFFYRNK